MSWVVVAIAAAFFAGLTSILAKCGIRTIDSDVATAIRTAVVLVFAWIMVALVGLAGQISSLTTTNWIFLCLSGIATGGSWICYFKALSIGDVNKVVPVDKSSTIIAALLAIVLFGETSHLWVKLVAIAVIAVGTYLMIEKTEQSPSESKGRSWLVYALLAAMFAALTSVLAKVGIEGVDSNLATAIRTVVVLVMAWIIVVWKGKSGLVRGVDRKELLFVCASGIATGASWLCFYYAIQAGQVSVVVQIDKLSILVSIAFAWLVFKERLSVRAAIGLALIVAGTAAMSIWV